MIRIKYIFIYILISLTFISVKGQDIFLSHYDAAPQYLNPSLTGMYFGERYNLRVNANYAAQTIGRFANVFNTAAVGIDFRYRKFGLGALIIDNNSGDGNYNVMDFLISGAYEISIDKAYRHNLLTGIQVGTFHHSFNQSKLFFESQYDYGSGGFDPTLSNNEDFASTSILRLDAGIGAFYSFRDRYKVFNPFFGFSIFHATSPNVSFYDNPAADKVYYPMRFTLHGGTGWNFNEKFQFAPRYLIMMQGSEYFADIGIFTYYLYVPNKELIFGADANTNDIMTVHAGMRYGGNIFRISYGFNSIFQSSLNTPRNDIEFSVIITKSNSAAPSF